MSNIILYNDDLFRRLDLMDKNSISSIIIDPPYAINFMSGSGIEWDCIDVPGGIQNVDGKVNPKAGATGKAHSHGFLYHNEHAFQKWCKRLGEKLLRVAKPGALFLCFGSPRTFHRMMCGIEDSGWICKDTLIYCYSSGMPKGLDVSKSIDKSKGLDRKVIGTKVGLPGYSLSPNKNEGRKTYGNYSDAKLECDITEPASDEAKQWQGWNTTLRPAYEPISVFYKELDGNYAHNALAHGVAGFNVDASRIPYQSEEDKNSATPQGKCTSKNSGAIGAEPDAGRNMSRVNFSRPHLKGRFPTNLLFDENAARLLDYQTGTLKSGYMKPGQQRKSSRGKGGYGGGFPDEASYTGTYGDSGGASRFFYVAKASQSEKNTGLEKGRNTHPTVKPLKLMKYLCTLVSYPNETLILDACMGSGTTGVACAYLGIDFIGIEKDKKYFEIAKKRIDHALNQKKKKKKKQIKERDLFG